MMYSYALASLKASARASGKSSEDDNRSQSNRRIQIIFGIISGLRFGHNLRALNWAKVTQGEASHKWLRQNAREGENSDAAMQEAL